MSSKGSCYLLHPPIICPSPSLHAMRRDASAPFNSNKADIVLRSSDDMYFRVYRCLLALASPFFDSMFDLPQPQAHSPHEEMYHGLEVIPVTENSRVLDMLLRFCYPASVDKLHPEKAADIERVLEAAVKYGMEEVEERVRRSLLEPSILEKEPLQVFAVAYRFRCEPEARAAATCLLGQPAPPANSTTLKYVSQGDLRNLAVYRAKCAQAVLALGSNLAWLQEKESYGFFKWWTNCCMCLQRADTRFLMHGAYAREWWAEYMEETLGILQETPCAAAVHQNVRKALERAAGCPFCRRKSQPYMSDFVKRFGEAVDEAIAGIPLGIPL
ncbi:hypothetical protein L210DRAFT_3523410 [Boletus edulis BED1]|uniref:BTB domain-containing protein n=1 Tax=Boletus edulis BED1 TaxID=1328754 RepID=A0AAD4C5G7_BOLED|nr:hypothetical protein L210DRAFT_3523410 [Boletus edulis BED1]